MIIDPFWFAPAVDLPGDPVTVTTFEFDPVTNPQSYYDITGLSNVLRIVITAARVQYSGGASDSIGVQVLKSGVPDTTGYSRRYWWDAGASGGAVISLLVTSGQADVSGIATLAGLTDDEVTINDSHDMAWSVTSREQEAYASKRDAAQVEDGIRILSYLGNTIVAGKIFGTIWSGV